METDQSSKKTSGKLVGVGRNLRERAQAIKLAFLLLVSISGGFVGGWYGAKSHNDHNAGLTNSTIQKQVVLSESQLISSIAKDMAESVVSVTVTSQTTTQDVFGFSSASPQQSAGTGFIISADGVIATNRHVVGQNATAVSVTMSDGTKLDNVEVIGRTNANDPLDIAFLKVKDKKGKTLKPVKLGDSSKVQVGDKVVAIGNALGQFQNTVTSGIISGYGRSVEASSGQGIGAATESLQNLFQTDAAINQGNSGGPLVNMNGEVIGINTAVADAQNIGFAIPTNDVQGLIKSVLTKGKLERPYLGVRYVTITDDYAYRYNLPAKRGAYLPPSADGAPSIIDGSPAAKAGLTEKDIITKINGTTLDEKNSLAGALGQLTDGQKVQLNLLRDGKEQTIDVALEAAPTE